MMEITERQSLRIWFTGLDIHPQKHHAFAATTDKISMEAGPITVKEKIKPPKLHLH